MAKVNYTALTQAIKVALDASGLVANARVLVEEPLNMAQADAGDIVCIYCEGRQPHGSQYIANGEQTRFLVRFSIWVASFNMESMAKALEQRDELLGNVELALMRDHTFDGAVDTSWLEGGELASVSGQGFPFTASGEIILIADKSANL